MSAQLQLLTSTRSGPSPTAFAARIAAREEACAVAARDPLVPGACERARSPTAGCGRRSSATATGSSTRKAFRRLKHKTQVFVAPAGDHYRTRLTHTLEVTQVARTAARALALNEDLAEAIGLGHDLGHTPFGHLGEDVLDRCLAERFGSRFRHNEQSLRVVDVLERDGAGLNLTEPVRDGIVEPFLARAASPRRPRA